MKSPNHPSLIIGKTMQVRCAVGLALLVAALVASAAARGEDVARPKEVTKADAKANTKTEWKRLFDGKTLDGWDVPVYGGDGEVAVKDKVIVIGAGASMTGIRLKSFEPKTNYELQYEAMRPSFGDFFATVTFPVDDTHCSFVLGGWGGSTIGISSINAMDASENATNDYYSFQDTKWYAIRIRVTDTKIGVWIRGEAVTDSKATEKDKEQSKEKQVVDLTRSGDDKLSVRWEMQAYRPLGFCTWSTTGHIRNIEYRLLSREETQ